MKAWVFALSLLVFSATSFLLAQDQSPLQFVGLTSLGPGEIAPDAPVPDDVYAQRTHPGHSSGDVHRGHHSDGDHHVPATIPTPDPQSVVGPGPGFFGFPGLNHFDQRFAGTGAYTNTQLSLEPPDQGLCVGDGAVMEVINNALAVYDFTGTRVAGPVALSQFFGLAPEVIRSTPVVFGQFISDPRCHFDPHVRRWFITETEFGRDPSTGAFTSPSSILIAVSETSNPVGNYFLYSIDTTDGDGTLPGHANCPCFGDQPLIGADANGFYVTTNEFPINGPGFNGAQIYAMSKSALVAGSLPTVVHINVGGTIPVPAADQASGGLWYSIQPAFSPGGERGDRGDRDTDTEYFLSSLQFGPAPYDNRIAVWALSDTDSLSRHTPHVRLLHKVIGTESYGMEGTFSAPQKPGSTPLRDALGDVDPLENLNGNDDRMNQVVFADGGLWAGVNTTLSVGGNTLLGIAWFEVRPSLHGDDLDAEVDKQGYVAVAGENVIFPSVGVNRDGKAVVAFTLVGPDYYPSAAYSRIRERAGRVHVAGAGLGPDDGFSGYASEGSPSPGIGRWGDYSAAVTDRDGNIWIAAEYIGQTCTLTQFLLDPNCGGTRTLLANWGTFIGRVDSDGD